jgi:hypothetical protein
LDPLIGSCRIGRQKNDPAGVLAAAVDLPSGCDPVPNRCDVEGDDGIDVVDAANVERRAFGLSAANDCVP